jgi:hypothetical protein
MLRTQLEDFGGRPLVTLIGGGKKPSGQKCRLTAGDILKRSKESPSRRKS